MFYPGGGYPGFYFWLLNQQAASPDAIVRVGPDDFVVAVQPDDYVVRIPPDDAKVVVP